MAMLGAPCSKCCGKCTNNNCLFLREFFEVTGESGNCSPEGTCCCFTDGLGDCFDPSVINENNELTEPLGSAPLRGHCLDCCSSLVYFAVKDLTTNAGNLDAWIAALTTWLQDHGYTNITSFNAPCHLGGTPEEETNNIAWVRACCDGTVEFVSEVGEEECQVGELIVENFNDVYVGPSANGEYICDCVPNPLP